MHLVTFYGKVRIFAIMMSDKKDLEQVCNNLRIIERTRLLYNTNEELGKAVGFSIASGNGLSRMGGRSLFMKDAIFRELAFMAKEHTELDLQSVVEAYKDVDAFVDRYGQRLHGDGVQAQIVDIYFGSGEVPEELAFVRKHLEDRHVALILLMLTGCLPRLSARSGDVEDIDKDYQRTFALMRKVCDNVILQELPAISLQEHELEAHPERKSRLHLIYMTDQILNAYGTISTQQRLSLANRELAYSRVSPPEIEGIWTENDSYTAFWQFEEVNNGYNLYHYTLKDNQQTLAYTRYFISFYEEESDQVLAVVLHPRSTRHIVKGQPIPKMYIAYFRFVMCDDGLSLSPKRTDDRWLGISHLRKSSHADYFKSMLNDGSRKLVNECPEGDYTFNCCLAALTADDIYIDCPDGGYYKIPKSLNDVLCDVQFGDSVGIVAFEGSQYIAFDDKNLYYDISTEEKMREQGIMLSAFVVIQAGAG